MVAAIAPRPDSAPPPSAGPRLYLVPGGAPQPRRRHRSAVYRRRRVVVLVVVVGMLMGVGLAARAVVDSAAGASAAVESATGASAAEASPAGASPAGASATTSLPPSQPRAPRVWIVHPGDTLWGIAVASGDQGDVRPLVDKLFAEVHGQPLQPGERITLP